MSFFCKRKESRSCIEPRSFRLPAYRLTARPNRLSLNQIVKYIYAVINQLYIHLRLYPLGDFNQLTLDWHQRWQTKAVKKTDHNYEYVRRQNELLPTKWRYLFCCQWSSFCWLSCRKSIYGVIGFNKGETRTIRVTGCYYRLAFLQKRTMSFVTKVLWKLMSSQLCRV